MSRHTKVIVVEEVEENEKEERNLSSVQIETKIQKTPPATPGTDRKYKGNTPPGFDGGLKPKVTLSPVITELPPDEPKKTSKMDLLTGNGATNKMKALTNGEGMLGAGGIFGAEPEDPDDPKPKQKMPKMMSPGLQKMREKAKIVGKINTAQKAFIQLSDDVQKGIEDTLLYKTLRPLFILMKMFGIFFVKRRNPLDLHHRLRNFRHCSFEQIWCTFIMVILTLNFLRSLSTFADADFSSFGNKIMFKALVVIFFYETCSRAGLAYRACYKEKDGLESLFSNIESVCYPDKIIPYENALKRTMWIFIVFTFILSLMNVASVVYGFYFASDELMELFDAYLAPAKTSTPGMEGFEAFVILMTFFNVQVAMLSLTFYTVICYMLDKEFEYSHRIFKMKIKDDGTFNDDLEKFRLNHQKRCNLVEEADGLFKEYIANTYTTNVPLLCLLVYGVINSELNDIAYRVISAYGTIYVTLQFTILSVAATLINIKAHALLGDLHGIRVSNTSTDRNLQVHMFLNKLTGTEIGLTAWDMFIINKPTILTMIGMILTYFFLLLQFQMSPAASTPANCTCLLDMANGTNVSLVAI